MRSALFSLWCDASVGKGADARFFLPRRRPEGTETHAAKSSKFATSIYGSGDEDDVIVIHGFMSVVTVGCEPEQTDRAEGSGRGARLRRTPIRGGTSNSWGNSLLVRRSKNWCRWRAGVSLSCAGTTKTRSKLHEQRKQTAPPAPALASAPRRWRTSSSGGLTMESDDGMKSDARAPSSIMMSYENPHEGDHFIGVHRRGLEHGGLSLVSCFHAGRPA